MGCYRCGIKGFVAEPSRNQGCIKLEFESFAERSGDSLSRKMRSWDGGTGSPRPATWSLMQPCHGTARTIKGVIPAGFSFLTLAAGLASDWTQFRGPSGTGVGDDALIPLEWSKDKNLAWKTAIPGVAWSQPVTGCVAAAWPGVPLLHTDLSENGPAWRQPIRAPLSRKKTKRTKAPAYLLYTKRCRLALRVHYVFIHNVILR
jgi:hypothetical protein